LDCLQRDTHHQAPKKPHPNPAPQRDKRRKPRFPCNGKLKISFDDNSQLLRILLSHDVSHVAYRTPRIPTKWKDYIREHKEGTPSKVATLISTNTLANIRLDMEEYFEEEQNKGRDWIQPAECALLLDEAR
jgi:hypothetical protein